MDKDGYVVDIRNLKFYRDHGLIIKKVHAVITFKQERWMKPYETTRGWVGLETACIWYSIMLTCNTIWRYLQLYA